MKNLDTIKQERSDIMQRMLGAVQENDTEKFMAEVDALADSIQMSILPDVRAFQQRQDEAVLVGRGCRVLTSEERQYYQGLMDAWKAPDPKQALTNFSVVMPRTVIDSVFDDIRANHPLLDAINFQNTEAMVKFLLSTGGGAARWGAIDAEYAEELAASFTEIDLTMASLLAYIPVARYMLDVGPEWVDRYVREILSESIALGLEAGIVDGDGKDRPIGMTRKLTGAVDGVYAQKIAVAIASFDAVAYGGILDVLAQGPNGHDRPVNSVILVVNPRDYFTKIFPATTPRNVNGGFNHDVFPFPTTVIQSAAMPRGKAIMGIASQYFMAIGGGTSGGRIEYSDEVRFIERQRVYGVHLYGYGRPKTENDFVLLDISGVKATALQVEVINAGDFPGAA